VTFHYRAAADRRERPIARQAGDAGKRNFKNEMLVRSRRERMVDKGRTVGNKKVVLTQKL
jgi:hypothetical protein